MLESIIVMCSIWGLAFLFKESDGPFGIMAWIRNKLMSNKYFGVFFYKLFDCYFCLGVWCGGFTYFLHEKYWNFNFLILWCLSGGAISLLMNGLFLKLYK